MISKPLSIEIIFQKSIRYEILSEKTIVMLINVKFFARIARND